MKKYCNHISYEEETRTYKATAMIYIKGNNVGECSQCKEQFELEIGICSFEFKPTNYPINTNNHANNA